MRALTSRVLKLLVVGTVTMCSASKELDKALELLVVGAVSVLLEYFSFKTLPLNYWDIKCTELGKYWQTHLLQCCALAFSGSSLSVED